MSIYSINMDEKKLKENIKIKSLFLFNILLNVILFPIFLLIGIIEWLSKIGNADLLAPIRKITSKKL